MSLRYQLVLLDAGFTLLHARRPMVQSVAEALAGFGHTPSETELRQAYATAERWFWQHYHQPGNTTWTHDETIRATWTAYHSVMLTDLGLAAQPALIESMFSAHFHAHNWQLYPDVLAALDELAALPIQLGIVSDWSSHLPKIIDALGIGEYFAFLLASGAVGLAKPDPRFYQRALELGGVPASAALMVGDSYHGDVGGARAAGIDALLLDRNASSAHTDVPVIRSLHEIIEFVRAS